ncbi:hypothetical protein COV49_04390 [Candidatus Falkowbacteria bacterium CG11_big_fil_rev_8_21_14_0_20_39_10]|uniref:Nucleotidyl transferase AbiEii/AbiGii toxin family protein n=1 Tax=Candidatus Falkowbacteria bacterium CG11_big_fil_rev_8_21_14_0_20_39_10 TaxID=1974570 RepID=A0A2M6K7U9_9BACT|nr:MAG: hypothetical protein COV49_04390 [Candidatus Falkowbacteria bacterium CG11_big_fil_rev_8_21_14_0_20_39_10]
MILPNPKEAIHKAWLYRLLSSIYGNQALANSLHFKGGTCAAMLGWLDRFSVDLDFDYVAGQEDLKTVNQELELIFKKLGLKVKDKSRAIPQYFLSYPAKESARNTIKIDTTWPPPKANIYEAKRLVDIDRIANCQTKETMFANKLVAMIDRWEKSNSIAGRDLYDIHYFFLNGFRYNEEVIIERRKGEVILFMKELVDFIEKRINQTVINQDINFLLPPDKFKRIRGVLKPEALMFLRDEIKRLKGNN